MESKTSERPVLEERPHTASSDLEDHLSKLTEENKKLAEELSSLKMQMTKSQVSNNDFLLLMLLLCHEDTRIW